jgi:hypothetical protein
MMADEPGGFWAYFELSGDDEGIVGAAIPGRGIMPLVTSRRRMLPALHRLAWSHAQSSGFAVELRRFAGPGRPILVFKPGDDAP